MVDLLLDVVVIIEYFEKNFVENVVVIGIGYIVIEMVEVFVERGKNVIFIGRSERVFRKIFDKEIIDIVEEKFRNYFNFCFEEVMFRIEGKERVERVVIDVGEYLVDFVIVVMGIKFNIEFVRGFGVRIGEIGVIWINDRM